MDDLCHVLAGETSCYIFIDDFHLLTDRRASLFLCMLANRLPINVHLIVASRDRFLPAAETVRLGAKVYQIGTEQLRLNHTELAVYAHRCGTALSEAQIESLLYSSEGWFSAVYLNLRTLSERGVLPLSLIHILDEAVLNRLIGKILVGEVEKIDGQKVQEVRIVYNFVGEIPVEG